ncbi:SHC SH2 domain-binding protein 1 isoform X1 [Gadus morhua]|uniref:SHC SH2 domain-binding protein 1 isoform X1 n=1 Tax=Gadus morhua TaxID=8049 RepID=UPI0011B5428B|nr:SHC SH2 domain-binding protein 1 isoform X1 [Gadus morhua]
MPTTLRPNANESHDTPVEEFELNLDSYVHVELETEDGNEIRIGNESFGLNQGISQKDSGQEDHDEVDDGDSDHLNSTDKSGTRLQRAERRCRGDVTLPDTFQTNQLLYYERFKAYQDYMLGDCKTSEVRAFISDYLEKAVEPCDWQALWSTDVFDVLVEVHAVDCKELKACVQLALPIQCETHGCDLNEESMRVLLEATQHKVPLQELQLVFEDSGDLDQTALAIEHLRFFYQHIWRIWDDEDEDDDFDYFVRCVEPRLRLYFDVLEDRVPAGLVAEYHSLLARCSELFQEFSSLRNDLTCDSDCELDNVSMVEGVKLYDQLEILKRKLCIIENPLLRYVLGYKGNARQHCVEAKGSRASGGRVIHVVTASTSASQLQSLLNDKLLHLCSADDTEIQFHSDPVLAVDACFQGDAVLILPGHYSVTSSLLLPDSITIEGFGLPDEVVIEKKNKGDTFVETTGAAIKISNVKFIQHDAIEGILCVRQGKLEMENCVLQCETTGVIVRTSAHLIMNLCDLYGSKGAGIEIYPGSVCSITGNGIHHCKEGVLIKDFADELDVMPRIIMENNVIHNNEGYGIILVKPTNRLQEGNGSVPLETAMDNLAEKDHGSEVAHEKLHQPQENPKAHANPPPEEVHGPLSTDGLVSPAASALATPRAASMNGLGVQHHILGETPEPATTTSTKKWQLCRQLSRNKDAGTTHTDMGLLEQKMFVSIQGNQFKRNGMGDFGTFLY